MLMGKNSLFRLVIGTFATLFICAVSIVIISTNNDIHLLFSNTKSALGDTGSAATLASSDLEKGVLIDSDTPGQAGLNLLLIGQLSNSYIKELLNLYSDSAAGKLDDYDVHLSVETLLGMHMQETGVYAGTSCLLKSYLPYENGAVVWNTEYEGLSAEQMTLRGFGQQEFNKVGDLYRINAGGKSIFQFTSWDSSGATKAKIDGATNAGRTGGQWEYLPDVLVAVNGHVNSMVASLDLDFNSAQLGVCSGLQHNRGLAGMKQLAMGISYSTRRSNSAIINGANDTFKQYPDDTINALSNLIESYLESHPSADLSTLSDSSSTKYVIGCLAVEDGSWFLSDNACSYLSITNGRKTLEVWNVLFPEDPISSTAELQQRFKASTPTSLAAAITTKTGVTVHSADTSSAYKTATDYDDCDYYTVNSAYSERGYIYRVSTNRSPDYVGKYTDGSDPFIVAGYDMISASYGVAASGFTGRVIYAKLLKLAGLTNIDATNPLTYSNPDWNATGAWYLQYNVDESKLTPDRVAVLNKAYEFYQLDIPYVLSHGSGIYTTIPQHLDCSSFVWRCYRDTIAPNIPLMTTAAMFTDYNTWETIAPSELAPGDICLIRKTNSQGAVSGHVMIYIGGSPEVSASSCWFIHESEPGVNIKINHGARTFSTSPTRALGVWIPLRYKGFNGH